MNNKYEICSIDDLVYSIWDFNSETGEWPEYRERVGIIIENYVQGRIERHIKGIEAMLAAQRDGGSTEKA